MSVEGILKLLGPGFFSFAREKGLTCGPQGLLLLRNLEAHWFRHCVTMQKFNVFPSQSSSHASALETWSSLLNVDELPIGLATVEETKAMWNKAFLPVDCKNISHRLAKVTALNYSALAKELFYKKQRERKVWWRKLSRNPSRFVLTETKKVDDRDILEIQAEFPFGNIILETLTYRRGLRKLFSKNPKEDLDVEDLRIVEHTASLDWGCLVLLCDSIDESNQLEKFHIHPRIAPYKVSFHLNKSEEQEGTLLEENSLNRLLLYLNNSLRNKGIDTIVTSSEQGRKMFHAPYVVSVDVRSLKTGIIRVTSQVTTIAEEVHVTDLVRYIELRCR